MRAMKSVKHAIKGARAARPPGHRRGRTLRRGMIVMTGSSITTKFPAPGDRVKFAIEGLGEVALEAVLS